MRVIVNKNVELNSQKTDDLCKTIDVNRSFWVGPMLGLGA